ncbi:MFS transporter [Streptomyces sp. Tu 2975]|uniref:MFS transporter n=1 Tax=Streptomyces sp. Tu 2975 TaxID=2676871 RepID=UPI001357A8A8|nr:hypothetical protein [Streptomyces sp. Tu 2975]QIP84233.1 MFS transporter [Streptomyces sp. Tu 2975]
MTAPWRATHPRRALAVLCTGLFLIGLDVTGMNVALPSLQSDLEAGQQGLLWMADAYSLALACCALTAGMWSDTQSRRRAFALGLALCGTAEVAGALTWGRCSSGTLTEVRPSCRRLTPDGESDERECLRRRTARPRRVTPPPARGHRQPEDRKLR